MESKRQHKFARQLQKDLSDIFQKDPRHYFGNALVTLTGVEMSPDLSFAKIFLSVLPFKDAEEVFFRINEHKNEVRKNLGNKIGKHVRIIPELAFYLDDTEEKASRLDRLIEGLNIPPDEDSKDESR